MTSKQLSRAFPVRYVDKMYDAIYSGREGVVAVNLHDGQQIWRNNLNDHLKRIDLLRSIKRKAHPVAFDLLRKYAQECATRIRPYKHFYNGRSRDGLTMCTQNSIYHALDTGMELWSGFACNGSTANWHLWNVDAQGFVYDTTYGGDSIFGRYLGFPIHVFQALELLELRASGLEGAYIYWGHFPKIEGLVQKQIGPLMTRRLFPNLMERALHNIMVV